MIRETKGFFESILDLYFGLLKFIFVDIFPWAVIIFAVCSWLYFSIKMIQVIMYDD
jgi:hypothetical protein